MEPVFSQTGAIQDRSIFDLSEKNATVNWNVKVESSSQSRDFFKIDSTMIKVELKSDIKSSVTVSLVDSAETELAEKTATFAAPVPEFTYDVEADGINAIVETQETDNMDSDIKKTFVNMLSQKVLFQREK